MRAAQKKADEQPTRHRRTKKEMEVYKRLEEQERAANGGRLRRGSKERLEEEARRIVNGDAAEAKGFELGKRAYAEDAGLGRDEAKVANIMRDADQAFERSLKDEPTDKKALKAMFGWAELKAKRGFTDATMILLFEDYLSKRKLHEDFVKFVGKR